MKLEMKLDRPLVVFDIESTGVNARQDRIIELAAIRVEPDGTETEKCWLLNPGVPIPPETTAIHGITDDIVKDCPTFADAAAEIVERGRALQKAFAQKLVDGLSEADVAVFHSCLAAIGDNIEDIRKNGLFPENRR